MKTKTKVNRMRVFDRINGLWAVAHHCSIGKVSDASRSCVQHLGSQWVTKGTRFGSQNQAYPPEHPVTWLFRFYRALWAMVLASCFALVAFGFLGGDRYAAMMSLLMLVVAAAVARTVCGANTFRQFAELLPSMQWAYRVIREGRNPTLMTRYAEGIQFPSASPDGR